MATIDSVLYHLYALSQARGAPVESQGVTTVVLQFDHAPTYQVTGQVIDSEFLRIQDYSTAAALSFVLMLVIVVIVAAYVRRAGTEELV